MRLPAFLALLVLGATWTHSFGPIGGGRAAPGQGTFPAWRALRMSAPAVRWLTALPRGRLAAVSQGGTFTVLEIGHDDLAVSTRLDHAGTAEAAPVVLRLGNDVWGAAFVTADGRLTVWSGTSPRVDSLASALSPLTHPTALDADGDGRDDLLAITRDGALVLVGELGQRGRILARLPIGALPDARVTVSPAREALVLTDPTDRYPHGVLGDTLEAGAVTAVAVEPTGLRLRGRWVPPADSVLEDQRVGLADVDGDGYPEALVTRAFLDAGAAQLVLASRRGTFRVVAVGPPIGRPNRWQQTVGAADLDGDGTPEVLWLRTPHLGGVLEAARLRGVALEPFAARRGVSSHAIRSRNLDQVAIADLTGDGRPEVLVPVGSRDAVVGLELSGASFRERWRYRLPGGISSNLVVADLDADGRLDLAVADRTSVHVALSAP